MTRNSIAETFKQYRKRLLQFIRSRVRLLEDAEDILQEVFYQFARVNALAQPVEQTAAWLYRAARNKIIDNVRKKKDESLPASYDEDTGYYIFDEIAAILYGEESTPETAYLRALIIEEIEAALDELPPAQREVFIQTELQGLPVKAISESSGVAVNTLLSRKHYAVVHLRKRLHDLYADLLP